jgi:hypothetical protein
LPVALADQAPGPARGEGVLEAPAFEAGPEAERVDAEAGGGQHGREHGGEVLRRHPRGGQAGDGRDRAGRGPTMCGFGSCRIPVRQLARSLLVGPVGPRERRNFGGTGRRLLVYGASMWARAPGVVRLLGRKRCEKVRKRCEKVRTGPWQVSAGTGRGAGGAGRGSATAGGPRGGPRRGPRGPEVRPGGRPRRGPGASPPLPRVGGSRG